MYYIYIDIYIIHKNRYTKLSVSTEESISCFGFLKKWALKNIQKKYKNYKIREEKIVKEPVKRKKKERSSTIFQINKYLFYLFSVRAEGGGQKKWRKMTSTAFQSPTPNIPSRMSWLEWGGWGLTWHPECINANHDLEQRPFRAASRPLHLTSSLQRCTGWSTAQTMPSGGEGGGGYKDATECRLLLDIQSTVVGVGGGD